MQAITSTLLSYVLLYKYLALIVITYLGAIALPLPSGTVLVASAAFATQTYLSLPWIIIVGIIGNIAGDNSGYWLARRYGVPVLKKLGMGRLAESDKAKTVGGEIIKHPMMIIFSSRFMTGIAPTVNVVSGIMRIPYKKYLTFEVLGECTEVSFFAITGWILGANWEYFYKLSWLIWVVLGIAITTMYLFWHLVLNPKKKSDPLIKEVEKRE